MRDTKHTPGPWKVVEPGEITGSVVADVAGIRVGTFNPPGPAYYDAHLIATAPEMLDFLDRLLTEEVLSDDGFLNRRATDELRALVKKVRGE